MLIVGSIVNNFANKSVSQNDNKSKLTLINPLINGTKKIPLLKNIITNNLAKQNAAAEAEVTNQNVLTAERIYTEQEINTMTEDQFIELTKDTDLRLPKLSEIKKIPPGALHHTPALIIQAGRDLGVLKEVLKVHKSYERDALPFYKSCALRSVIPTPVRALCLTNLIEIKKNNNESINLGEFPDSLTELSRMVSGI